MKQIGKKHHKNLAALIIVLTLSGAVIGGHLTGALDFVEFRIYDLRINLFARSHPRSQDITLVLLDQDSLEWGQSERGWPWPWPRKAYAEFLDYMNLAGARAVIFDVLFSEPSIYRSARQEEIIDDALKNMELAQAAIAGGEFRAAAPLFREAVNNLHELSVREDDASFARAAENFGRAVQAVFFSTQTGSVDAWPADLDKPLFKADNFGSFFQKFHCHASVSVIDFPFLPNPAIF